MISEIIGDILWWSIVDSLRYIFSPKTRKRIQEKWRTENASPLYKITYPILGVVWILLAMILIILVANQ